jgi:phosphoglycolate phosphatase-like HAD superfamily hydrolase
LERNGIAEVFCGVYGGVQPWMKGRALKKIRRKLKLDAGETWYVGDGYLDVKAAHRAGMKAMAVTWGYSNLHVLESCRPEALVFTSDELLAHFVRGR